ncbi:hypothetical protein MPH_02719 [Macrophomina phaseolina MS6]|uniref:Uncharacterized protein n=1 Tax=Macrophomina phaseolina (strain MS6) TaxID=1126212 RepID=K2SC75_MACPH|nr:hypothetical protein MPH_02719 [Macrophomina phaseolina MS6]
MHLFRQKGICDHVHDGPDGVATRNAILLPKSTPPRYAWLLRPGQWCMWRRFGPHRSGASCRPGLLGTWIPGHCTRSDVPLSSETETTSENEGARSRLSTRRMVFLYQSSEKGGLINMSSTTHIAMPAPKSLIFTPLPAIWPHPSIRPLPVSDLRS